MNTQNVKTAAPESTERYGKDTILRMDSFITDISSSHAYDVIRADVVTGRMEHQAHAGSGLHDEFYEFRLIRSAMYHLHNLPLKDRPMFIDAADRKGITLSWTEEERSQAAYSEMMQEIAAELK